MTQTRMRGQIPKNVGRGVQLSSGNRYPTLEENVAIFSLIPVSDQNQLSNCLGVRKHRLFYKLNQYIADASAKNILTFSDQKSKRQNS